MLEMSLAEQAKALLLIAGMGFAFMVPVVWICGRLIGLKERPERRALWTAIPPYLVAAVVAPTGDMLPIWANPLIQLPGAVVIYLWLLNTYRKGWIDDDKVPEGTVLENSDWRVGATIIAALVGAVIAKMVVRALSGS